MAAPNQDPWVSDTTPNNCLASVLMQRHRGQDKNPTSMAHAMATLTKQPLDSIRQEGSFPVSKVHGANMGPTWGRQDPGGPHVGPMNLAIWAGKLKLGPGLDD